MEGHERRTQQLGQEDERFLCLRIFEANPAQVMRTVFVIAVSRQGHRLSADNARAPPFGYAGILYR